MSVYKKTSFFIFLMIFISSAAFYVGCSSAESTTGKLAFQQKDYAKAVTELKKGLAIDQNDDEGWFMLGYSLIETGNYPDAQSAFKKSLAISNNYGEQMRNFWVQKYNAGANDFQTGVDLENNKNVTGAKPYYESALKNFEASSSIMPDSVRSISAIGETYLALGQDEKALEIFSDLSAKSRSPEYSIKVAKVMFESGLGMMQSNNYSPAVEVFKKIILLPNLPDDNPYHETSAYNLALALSKTGEVKRNADENSDYQVYFNEALVYLEPLTKDLKKKDLEPQIYELLVSVYANLGMTDKAEDALNKKNALQK